MTLKKSSFQIRPLMLAIIPVCWSVNVLLCSAILRAGYCPCDASYAKLGAHGLGHGPCPDPDPDPGPGPGPDPAAPSHLDPYLGTRRPSTFLATSFSDLSCAAARPPDEETCCGPSRQREERPTYSRAGKTWLRPNVEANEQAPCLEVDEHYLGCGRETNLPTERGA